MMITTLTNYINTAELEKKLQQERRRVEIQLMHEEAYIAKEEKKKENREIVQEIKEEKETFKAITEQSKREEGEQKRKVIEEIHEIQDSIIKAKQTILEDNVKKAADMVQEKKAMLEKAMRDAEEERQRKADLIKEIRLLEKHVTPHVKQVDLSKTAKLGLLTEMSILEVKLLVNGMKHSFLLNHHQ
jgi:hypothetical protein